MDTRRILEHPVLAPVLSVTFNHDNSCFAVGLDHGFRSKPRESLVVCRFDVIHMGQTLMACVHLVYESGSCVLRTSRGKSRQNRVLSLQQ